MTTPSQTSPPNFSAPTIYPVRVLSAIFRAVITGELSSLRRLSILAEGEDGESLVHWLCGHGLAETVLGGLSQIYALTDFSAHELLVAKVRVRTARHLAQLAVLEEVGAAFHALDICAATTGAHGIVGGLYPFGAIRVGSDIDLVIAEADYDRACEQLAKSGFTQGVYPELYTREGVTVDLAARPSDLIRFTTRPEERLGFPGVDDEWQTHLQAGAVAGIQYFSRPYECLLSALHYAYKHRFSRHGWGLDLILLARAMRPDELIALDDLARQTGGDIYFRHITNHLNRLATCPALPQLSGIAPTRDERWLRALLLRRFASGATTSDQGYLIALAQCEDISFRLKLLRQVLFPSRTPERRDRLPDGALPETISTAQRLRQLAALPRRVIHAIISGRSDLTPRP